jgi:hypothetical protein
VNDPRRDDPECVVRAIPPQLALFR